MLYQIKDGTVSAGGQTILSHVDFYIKEKEKIAVVGKNGAGKTDRQIKDRPVPVFYFFSNYCIIAAKELRLWMILNVGGAGSLQPRKNI